jgi:hypothetical protein
MTIEEARQALADLDSAEAANHYQARFKSWRPLALARPDLYARAREAREVLRSLGRAPRKEATDG